MNLEESKNSKNFCVLPWIHMHVWPNGKTFPCCLTPYSEDIGDANSGLKAVWNGDKMKQLRLNMLSDKPSVGCQRCYEHESTGYESLRVNANRDYNHWREYALNNTNDDGSVDEMRLVYLDIRFSNLCNLSCRTCGPALSSSWYDDSLALGDIGPQWPKFQRLRTTVDDLWSELEPNLEHVEGIYFAGGEPLMMEEHYRILNYLIERGKTDVTINYNTNFTTLKYKDQDVIELWKQFKRPVRIGASIDGMFERGEYIRKGFKWDRFIENLKRVKEELPRVDVYISCTLSVFNALHMPDFHRHMVDTGLIRPADWDVNVLLHPEHYRFQILPAHIKEEFIAKYEETLAWLEQHPGTARAVNGYRSAIGYMKQHDLHEQEWPKFMRLTNKVDALREEDFAKTFPELLR